MRHGFITLCVALGRLSILHIRWLLCLCFHLKLLLYSRAVFLLYDRDRLGSSSYTLSRPLIALLDAFAFRHKILSGRREKIVRDKATSHEWLKLPCYLTAVYFEIVSGACSIDYYFSPPQKKTNEPRESC